MLRELCFSIASVLQGAHVSGRVSIQPLVTEI